MASVNRSFFTLLGTIFERMRDRREESKKRGEKEKERKKVTAAAALAPPLLPFPTNERPRVERNNLSWEEESENGWEQPQFARGVGQVME